MPLLERRIRTISDVVDWGLCIGCGACYYMCEKAAVTLRDIENIGIRPKFKEDICSSCNDCLLICPGYRVEVKNESDNDQKKENWDLLCGHTIETWEGYATDNELRYRASSGGILSALAMFCLEKENMKFVLHTGMNPKKPWTNITVCSRDRNDLLTYAGSRYSPSSPCDSLHLIEHSDIPCVFIGKPCDVAAVSLLRKKRPALDSNLGLVLTFICAGTPSTYATIKLIKQLNINQDEINELRYRGYGWPGNFNIIYQNRLKEKSLPYKHSWSSLAKQRPFRCHLCPDGLGELADLSCGDAWHRYKDNEDKGISTVLVRTQRGKEILHRAMKNGFLCLKKANISEVVAGQELVKRRQEVFGRLFAMRFLLIPIPHFVGFSLFKAWSLNRFIKKIKTILGTHKRIMQRGLWRKNPL